MRSFLLTFLVTVTLCVPSGLRGQSVDSRLPLPKSRIEAPKRQGQQPSPVPPGMVAFFLGDACPRGWVVAASAQGRILVALTSADEAESFGEPLSDRIAPMHQHEFRAEIRRDRKTGYPNYDPRTTAGQYAEVLLLEDVTKEAASGLPFVQLLVCRAN